MKKKCVIFGAGGYGHKAYELLQDKYDIIGFSDNDEKKWGKILLDKSIVQPDSLIQIKDIIIIIASQWYAAINSQLRKIGIENIMVFLCKTSEKIVSNNTPYILCELPKDKLFEKCKLDWEKIDKIKTDFSENYEKMSISKSSLLEKENGLKKVLFCANWFPPIGGVGVQRSLKFVKYLRNYGYEPIVLTCMPDNCWHFVIDETLLKEIEDDITIIRINNDVYLYEMIPEEEQQEILNLYAGITESKQWIEQYIKFQGKLSPTTSICWVNRCLKYIESKIDLNKIDLIYTTGDPYETYILGYYIKNKYEIPWVQDYRDPWCTNKYFIENIYDSLWTQTFFMQEKLEEKLVQKSDIVLVAAEGMIEEFVIKYNVNESKFIEINNGYDEEDFKNICVKTDKNEKFTLCYNGHVYKTTNPITLLHTINKMIEQKKINTDKIQWIFNGVVENEWKQRLDKDDKYKIIKYNGHLSHSDGIQIAINSDVLVLFGGIGEGAKMIYTGKAFEYLRMKKPICCFSSKDGVLDKLLTKTQTGETFEYDDFDNLEKYLLQLYQRWEKGDNIIEVNEKEIEKYSRENETKCLAEVFNKIIN